MRSRTCQAGESPTPVSGTGLKLGHRDSEGRSSASVHRTSVSCLEVGEYDGDSGAVLGASLSPGERLPGEERRDPPDLHRAVCNVLWDWGQRLGSSAGSFPFHI